MTEPARVSSCRAILARWREQPRFDFPPPYEPFGPPLEMLASDPAAARLVDGAVLRIGRGDPPSSISAWVRNFAARRDITLPAAFPR